MSTTHERQVLWELVKSETGITIAELTNKTNVSSRTIYTDIKNIKTYLNEKYSIELKKEDRCFYLEEDDRKYLLDEEFNVDSGQGFSNRPRKYQIIDFLLQKKTTTLQEIADSLYFSKSTINHDMKEVERILSKFSIHLEKKPYHGIVVQGTEMNFRFLMQYLMNEQLESDEGDLESILYAQKFINNDINLNIKRVLEKYNSLNSIEMFLCINCMYNRVSGGNHFIASEEIIQMYDNDPLKNDVKLLLEDLNSNLNLSLHEDEMYYLLINAESAELDYGNNEYLEKVLQEILSLMKDKYQDVNIEENSFYTGLLVHISSMLKRLKVGKVVKNPVLDEIKETLAYAFHIAADIAMMLNEKFEIFMNEEEIGLLSMHIQAIIEESKTYHDTKCEGVVVSHIGYGNAKMISSKLVSQIEGLNIKNHLSTMQVESLIKENGIKKDVVVISTSPLSLSKGEYVQVKPIISDEDIKNVKKHINKQLEVSLKQDYSSSFINHLLIDQMFLQKQFSSKEELLKFVCNELYKCGNVTEEFYESTLAREKIASTYALSGVALPHGYSKYVKRPGISIVTLSNPVNWDEYYADIVFVCALSLNVRETEKMMFEEMYDLLNSKETLEKIKATTSKSEVIEILKEYIEENSYAN